MEVTVGDYLSFGIETLITGGIYLALKWAKSLRD